MGDEKDSLLVFGYSAKLFRDDEKALFIHKGNHLIPWMGDVKLMIDRYDCRGHLNEIQAYDSTSSDYTVSKEEIRVEKLCDEERYMALYKDVSLEEELYQEELKRLHLAIATDDTTYRQIGFKYDETDLETNEVEANIEESDDKFVPPDELQLPDNMEIPSTMKLNTIIEMTALFVCQQGSQMEIVMKTKQANNPQFKFMNYDHNLNSYYKHMIKMIREGKYRPQKIVPQPKKVAVVAEDLSGSEDEDYLHPSLFKKSDEPHPPDRESKNAGEQKVINELNHKIDEIRQQVALKSTSNNAYSKLVSQIKQQNDLFKAKEEQLVKSKMIKETMEMPSTSESSTDEENVSPTTPPQSLVSYDRSSKGKLNGKKKKTYYQEYRDYVESVHYEVPEHIRLVVAKLVEYVVRNGIVFEREIAAKTESGLGDLRFAFLADPTNLHFPYYVYQLKKYYDEQRALHNEARTIAQETSLEEGDAIVDGSSESNPDQLEADPLHQNNNHKLPVNVPKVRLEKLDLRAKERLSRRLHFRPAAVKKDIYLDKNDPSSKTSVSLCKKGHLPNLALDKFICSDDVLKDPLFDNSTSILRQDGTVVNLKSKDYHKHHHGGPICFSIRNKRSEKSLPFKQVTMLLYESSSDSSDDANCNESIDENAGHINNGDVHKDIDGEDLDLEKIRQAQHVTHNADLEIISTSTSVIKKASSSTTISVTRNQGSSSPLGFELIIENDPEEILNRLLMDNAIKTKSTLPSLQAQELPSTDPIIRPHPHINRELMDRSVDVTKSVQAERKKRAALFIKMLKTKDKPKEPDSISALGSSATFIDPSNTNCHKTIGDPSSTPTGISTKDDSSIMEMNQDIFYDGPSQTNEVEKIEFRGDKRITDSLIIKETSLELVDLLEESKNLQNHEIEKNVEDIIKTASYPNTEVKDEYNTPSNSVDIEVLNVSSGEGELNNSGCCDTEELNTEKEGKKRSKKKERHKEKRAAKRHKKDKRKSLEEGEI